MFHLRAPAFASVVALIAIVAGCGTAPPSAQTTATPATPAQSTTPPTTSAPPQFTPLLASVVAAPVPVSASDGKVHLAYELLVTNMLGSDVDLRSLTVSAGDRQLLTLAGEKLSYWMRVAGAGTTPTSRLGAGQAAIIWLDVAVDPDAVPGQLQHTLDVAPAVPSPPLIPATVAENVAPLTVSDRKPITINPPLTGQMWLNGDSCCDMGGHRMAMNPVNGGVWAAERFAIDYVQLSADKTLFKGPVTDLASYPYFGVDVHAVGDGPVVAVVDDLPEQVPGANPTGLTLPEYEGNHVVQDLGNGNYASYAHLKTGSAKVKPGDRLTTGQVIANLGNSGNTDAPHLHFQVMDGPDPMHANGLPFVFKSYTLDSMLASVAALGPLGAGKPADLRSSFDPRDESGTYPLMLDVMTYGGG